MADPFAIIGVASSIITFVDVGIKITKLIRESRNGTLQQVEALEFSAREIQARCAEIKQNGGQILSDQERIILSQATECDRLASELCKLLEKLKSKDGTWLESSRVAFKMFRNRPVLEDLDRRLAILDERMRSSLSRALQKESKSAIVSELESLKASQIQFKINCDNNLSSIREEILQLVAQKHDNTESDRSRIGECLGFLEMNGNKQKQELRIIRSLHFPEIRWRWSQIKDAEHRTNNWLFDRKTTNFSEWLESGNGIYWISGKAGSGKSTLMKFASEHPKTQRALKQWAHPAEAYAPSFYFWNQGFEMQKSQTGLLQSILYQILKTTPRIAIEVCSNRLTHEGWHIDELKATLERVLDQKCLPAKFCFFIDGLDEYSGEEKHLVQILSSFANNPHVKLCMSSRQRLDLEKRFRDSRQTLTIHEFTTEDMKRYVREELQENPKFKELQASAPACNSIITQIAKDAQGVWLWVYLVTRDLVHAVDRNEGMSTLQKILQEFPPDLEAYFNRIIEDIKPFYKEEMAQIFLNTIEQVHPLPLFVFSLLENERLDTNYAIRAPISLLSRERVAIVDELWKTRIQNRCGDLVIVNDKDHPLILQHPVDYLHRTVGDFLQDRYYERLKELAPDFNPHISLCKMMLFLLKGLPKIEAKEQNAITTIIGIVDEILYYAHETLKRDQQAAPILVELLDEVDRVNCQQVVYMRNRHWTHIRDPPTARGNDKYLEGGNCNFLALAIQARLVEYVRAKLQSDLRLSNKKGRPLLDYALRPRRVTPIAMPYHSLRDDPSVDIGMLQLLLEHGADPNQPIHLNDGRTVWGSFLLSCHETNKRGQPPSSLKDAWYQASELLISHGAISECGFGKGSQVLTVFDMIYQIFDDDKAIRLHTLLEENDQLSRDQRSWITNLRITISSIF